MTRPPASDPLSRRGPLAFALVVLLVLTGCNSPFATNHQYPPGVNESGVQNATALANEHESELQTGYRAESHSTVVAGNGSTLITIESDTRWSPFAANRTIRHSRDHPVFGVYSEVYSNESAIFVRIRRGSGNISIHRLGTGHTRLLIPGPNSEWEIIYGMVGARETSTSLLENGTTRIQIQGAELGRGTGNATLYVREDGLVTRYRATYQTRFLTTPVTFHTRTTYSQVGNADVVKPEWVANASTAE